MAKKKLTDVIGPEKPKEKNEVFFGDCWVFAKDAGFADQINPYLIHPPSCSPVVAGSKWYDKVVFIVPKQYDPLAYMVDVLELDPLMIVTNKRDLDLTGMHRFGYVDYNVSTRRGTAKTTYNPNGKIELTCPSDDPLFILKNGEETPIHRKRNFPMTSFPVGFSGSGLDEIAARDAQCREFLEDDRLEWVRTTIARCNSVDWERTLCVPSYFDEGVFTGRECERSYPKILTNHPETILKWILCPGWYLYDGMMHSILPELRPFVMAGNVEKLDALLTKHLDDLHRKFFTGKVANDLFVASIYIEYHTNFTWR